MIITAFALKKVTREHATRRTPPTTVFARREVSYLTPGTDENSNGNAAAITGFPAAALASSACHAPGHQDPTTL